MIVAWLCFNSGRMAFRGVFSLSVGYASSIMSSTFRFDRFVSSSSMTLSSTDFSDMLPMMRPSEVTGICESPYFFIVLMASLTSLFLSIVVTFLFMMSFAFNPCLVSM